MTARKIRIGVIGAGKIASETHVPILKAIKGIDVSWIYDTSEQRATAAGKAHGIKSLTGMQTLPNADIMLLAIPLPPRHPYFDLALKRESAIFAEKPLATTAKEHEALMRAFAPWQLNVGYQRRTYATVRFLKDAIQNGSFGTLRTIRIREGGRTARAGDYGSFQDAGIAQGGGISLNLGCHSLDAALWMTGATAHEILNRQIVWDGDTDRRAHARLVLQGQANSQSNESILEWTVSWLDSQPNTIEVEFETLTLRAPIQASNRIEMRDKSRRLMAVLNPAGTTGATTSYQAFYLEWQDVIVSVLNKQKSEFSAESSLSVARIIDELLTG